MAPREPSNSMANWPIESFHTLPGNPSVVPGGDQAVADYDDLQLEPVDDTTRSPISQQSWRHPDITPQIQETLSQLPCSRPVSAPGRTDGQEGKPFEVPTHGPNQTTPLTRTEPAVEPQLTHRRRTRKEANGSSLISRSKENATPESTVDENFSSALLSRQQQDDPIDIKTDISDAARLEPASAYSVSIEGPPGKTVSREGKIQKDEIMKVLEGIPTDILSGYLMQKGISSNPGDGKDSDESEAKQKHHCTRTRCERKFSRRSELKYVTVSYYWYIVTLSR